MRASSRGWATRALWLGCVLASAACGSASITTPDSPPPPTGTTPDPPYYVTITASGVSPVTHVWRGRAVIFRNDDARSHSFYADPHPGHYECSGLLNLGTLKAGERREIPNMPINACFFHCEEDPSQTAFQGVVVVH